MKANELRIGNYVYADWVDAGRKLEINYGVHYGTETMVMDVTPAGYGIALSFVEPIPLTEDWLLKSGFKKSKHWYTLGGIAISTDMNWLTQKVDGMYVEFYNQFKCPKYVHQLQNLYFALTGEELTIKE